MQESELPELVLVEDEIDDELLTIRGIEKSGIACRITVKRDGASAIDHLLEGSQPTPAFVLLDFALPRRNGLEILQAVRSDERTRLIPIVIFSGDHSSEVVIECYRHGTNGWVKKPMDPDEYVDKVSQLVRYWLASKDQIS